MTDYTTAHSDRWPTPPADNYAATETAATVRPPHDYDLHFLAGIGYHLAIGIDLDRYDARAPELTPAWYVVDAPPVGPGEAHDVHWFATQADAFAYAVNRLIDENENETGDHEHRRLEVVTR